MVNKPADELTIADPSLFLGEATARLRIAAQIVQSASDDPEDWSGANGWAQTVACQMIEDVADAIEKYEAALGAKGGVR